MLHQDYDRKCSVETIMLFVSRGLLPRRTDWRETDSRKVTLTLTSSRETGRPTRTNPQLSDSNKNLVLALRCVLTPRQTGGLTVGRNVTFTLVESLESCSGEK
jgi:hypothetical protein